MDLPGYGHASVPGAIRATWGPMADALRNGSPLPRCWWWWIAGAAWGSWTWHCIEWAAREPARTHVLLSKADKLPSGQAKTALREAGIALEGLASCQLFSAQKGTGVDEARAVMKRWLAESTKK